MRISTSQYYESSAASYQRNYSNLVKTSEEATDYVRVRTAADDPVGAARLLQLDQQSSMLAQFKTNANTVKNALGQSESVLNAINNVLQRVNELALGAGNAGYTDAERKANATELGQLEEQLLSLMNSRDESGQYMFAGSKSDTQPFVRNSDGSFSYQGDQTQLQLQVGDMLTMASNDSGFSAFQQALNTSRSQTSQISGPTPDTGMVKLSNGQVSESVNYNDRFRSGEPYTVQMVSDTQFKIVDKDGNDRTSEATGNGTFNPNTAGGSMVTFRGVDLRLNINRKEGDDVTTINQYSFKLESKPDSISGSRSPGNSSLSQVTGATVTDADKYNAMFPGGGAVVKFTTGGNYELYAQPLTADSRPVASGALSGSTITAAGVEFTFTNPPLPADGDQFAVQVNKHQTQSPLDTIGQLRKALERPIDGSEASQQQLRADLDSAIANISSGMKQVGTTVTSIGARGKALEVQEATNESLGIANANTAASIRDSDPAEVAVRLTLQQAMLQASQLTFSKVSQLSLFNRL